MKDQKPWVKALQIEDSAVNEWLGEIPSPDFLTFWSLDRGKINSDQYFNWAKEHYGLAVLKSDFFKQPANTQLWTQMESVANWSPQMIPVHEWDGVIFVACVEPDTDIQWSFPVQYVLASTTDLKAHWETLNSAESAAPVVTQAIAATTPPEPELAESSPDAPPLEMPVESEQAVAEEAAEAPEGISINFETNADGAPAEDDAPMSEDELQTNPGEVPIGLSTEVPAAPVLQLDNLMPVSDDAPQEPATPVAETTPEQQATPIQEIQPPAPVAPVQEAQPAAPVQAEVVAPKIPNSPPPPANYDTGTSFNEITRVAGILDHLKSDFEGSILLSMEGDQLKPLVWDSHWKPVGESKGPDNLKDASAFRVVVRTKHPYLGHVVDTPVNRSFFTSWGINEFPEKVLVQPIKDGQSLLAVMVCICNPGVKNQVLLSAGSKHAQELAHMLHEESQAKAA